MHCAIRDSYITRTKSPLATSDSKNLTTRPATIGERRQSARLSACVLREGPEHKHSLRFAFAGHPRQRGASWLRDQGIIPRGDKFLENVYSKSVHSENEAQSPLHHSWQAG